MSPENLRGTVVTLAADYLFKVNEDTTKLREKSSDLFHGYMVKGGRSNMKMGNDFPVYSYCLT